VDRPAAGRSLRDWLTGIWGFSATDVYAVGGAGPVGGLIVHYEPVP
jgi:hypothetical protein